MSPGDILFLYTDGVYDGSDKEQRLQIERVIRDHKTRGAKEICNAVLEHAVNRMSTCGKSGSGPDRRQDSIHHQAQVVPIPL